MRTKKAKSAKNRRPKANTDNPFVVQNGEVLLDVRSLKQISPMKES